MMGVYLMASKYELPFSTEYVPSWTYVEAFRELFQNALDNEIVSPENEMLFEYNKEKQSLSVSNKTSVLELKSLLLGSTTKAKDDRTIGQHGEGYKIAFLVLLREGKSITVYNYGRREIWRTKLIKSKRYDGQLVPTITVEKEAFWKDIPDSDLIIEVSGVTEDEYNEIVKKNLNLQDTVECYDVNFYGRILTSAREVGNLYVKGLFICRDESLTHGYDFNPSLVNLDRDRKLLSNFDIVWNTSVMWKTAFAQDFGRTEVLSMIEESSPDVRYINTVSGSTGCINVDEEIATAITKRFLHIYGEEAIPVSSNDELQSVGDARKAVLVSNMVAEYIDKSDIEVEKAPQRDKVSRELEDFLDQIVDKLDEEEYDRLQAIIVRVKKLEA
jgi:hypothetical protein